MQQTNRFAKLQHELSPLPYGMDALAPHISRETLEYHYGKHHRAYVNKLNELVRGTEFEGMALPDLIRQTKGPLFNNAAQVWNHNFYWNCLSPTGSRTPSPALGQSIRASFGSFDEFAARFKSSAAGKFGSGWTWLTKGADGALSIQNGDDADNPLCWNRVPLLTCDVWEHAYYIDYRNERARYVDAFWRLVDWGFVDRAFDHQ